MIVSNTVMLCTGGPLSEDRLASDIRTFFLASFQTTDYSAAWLMYLAAQHPASLPQSMHVIKQLHMCRWSLIRRPSGVRDRHLLPCWL